MDNSGVLRLDNQLCLALYIVSLTETGLDLQKAFLDLPQKMFCQLGLTATDAGRLKELLDALLKNQAFRNE